MASHLQIDHEHNHAENSPGNPGKIFTFNRNQTGIQSITHFGITVNLFTYWIADSF
jgi:hypothetical protein